MAALRAPAYAVSRSNVVAGLLLRDLTVLRRNWQSFLIRITAQPALFIFVFAYVFPKIGQGIGGAEGSVAFSTLLVPGTISLAMFQNGIQSVGIPLMNDLGLTREVEDRASAPVPTWFITGAKVLAGSIEGVLAGMLVLPFALLVPSTEIRLDVNIPAAALIVTIGAVTGSCFGLFLGTHVKPAQLQLMFTAVVLPLTFLGASYYSWQSLDAVPLVQTLVLVNPLVYVNEAMRAAMSPSIPHMAPWVSFPVAALFSILMFWSGTRAFAKHLSG